MVTGKENVKKSFTAHVFIKIGSI